METFTYMVRKEAKSLALRLGFARPTGYRILLMHLALIAAFGVWLPWLKGLDFLDPVMLSAFACLSMLFAAPAAAQAFQEWRPVSLGAVLARILVAVAYGELMAAAILSAGIATVYATHRGGIYLAPDLVSLAGAGLLGITGSLALAAAAGWITLRFSAGAARGALRVIFLALLCLFFFRARWLPDVAVTGAVICLAIAAGMILLLRREIR